MVFGQRIDQIGGRHRFADAISPATAFDQVIEEESNEAVRLQETAVLVHDSKTVGITVGRDSDVRARFPHLCPQFVEQMIVGFRGMPPKSTSR